MVNIKMFKKEEEKLNEVKDRYENIEIPDNIDDYIVNGIKKGEEEGSKRTRKRTSTRYLGYAVSLLIVLFIISIRFSPTFAEIVSSIPGVDYIVKLINFDKGLKLAVENEFLQHVGISDEHEGIIFTVEDIIADESRLIVFYSLKSKGDYDYVNLAHVRLFNEEGEGLSASTNWGNFANEDVKKEKCLKGRINVNLQDELPNNVIMEVKIEENIRKPEPVKDSRVGDDMNFERDVRILDAVWSVKIPIDKEKFQGLKKSYNIDKVIEIDNQKIYFKELIQHPTRIALDIQYDENNTKEIFDFENLRIADENGEWFTIANGVSGTQIDENTKRLYLQSNYFNNPKELYIKADGIRALDKDKTTVKVDIEKKLIINPPDDKIKLIDVETSNGGKGLTLVFGLKSQDNKDENGVTKLYGVFSSTFKDIEGNEYHSTIEGTYTIKEEFNNIISYCIEKNKNYKNPLVLEIYDYPSKIMEEINIKVK